MQPEQGQDPQAGQQVLVVGPDGQPVEQALVTIGEPAADGSGPSETNPIEQVEQPAKVMRIGSMVKQLLEEVRAAPLDDAARERLRSAHASSIAELADGLAPELREELDRLTLPFGDDATPSDAELRVAQAQLVGWLEGLFHGIQTALVAQQMSARLAMERGGGRPALIAPPGAGQPGPAGGTGQYL